MHASFMPLYHGSWCGGELSQGCSGLAVHGLLFTLHFCLAHSLFAVLVLTSCWPGSGIISLQGLLEAAKAAEEKAQLLQKLKEQQEHRAAVAAAKQRAQQATAQQQRPPQQAQQAQQAVPTQAQAAGGGGVQGVIHRGKWARKG